MNTTVINLTDDGEIREEVLALCRRYLLRACDGFPLVVVSQSERTEFGDTNISLGKMTRCWLSLYTQLLAGLEAAKTKNVAIAEHDMIYTREHFSFVPRKPDISYHNENMWLLQWVTPEGSHPEYNGMFSFRPRRLSLASQVVNREFFLRQTRERLDAIQASPRALHIAQRETKKALHIAKLIPEHTAKYKDAWELFATKVPILDIRHDHNFSGPKRGKQRRWSLPPWGALEDLIDGKFA